MRRTLTFAAFAAAHLTLSRAAAVGSLGPTIVEYPCAGGFCSQAVRKTVVGGGDPPDTEGIIIVDGPPELVADLTLAAGWSIWNCDSRKLTQEILLVCAQDERSCDDVFEGGAEHTIVRLPDDCGAGPFARIASARKAQGEKPPERILKKMRPGTRSQSIWAFQLDVNFSAIPDNKGVVTFAATAANTFHPDKRLTASRMLKLMRRGQPSRQNQRREDTHPLIQEFFRSVIGTVQPPDAHTSDVGHSAQLTTMSLDYESSEFNLLGRSLDRGQNSGALAVTAQFTTKGHATLGYAAVGTLVPPYLAHYGIYAGVYVDITSHFTLKGSISHVLQLVTPRLFETQLPFLEIPGILSLGPSFSLSTNLKATSFSADIGMTGNYVVQQAEFIHPPQYGASHGTVDTVNSPFSLTLPEAEQFAAIVQARLIPKLSIGLNAFSGFATANTFIDMEVGPTLRGWIQRDSNPRLSVGARFPEEPCVDLSVAWDLRAGIEGGIQPWFGSSYSISIFQKTQILWERCFPVEIPRQIASTTTSQQDSPVPPASQELAFVPVVSSQTPPAEDQQPRPPLRDSSAFVYAMLVFVLVSVLGNVGVFIPTIVPVHNSHQESLRIIMDQTKSRKRKHRKSAPTLTLSDGDDSEQELVSPKRKKAMLSPPKTPNVSQKASSRNAKTTPRPLRRTESMQSATRKLRPVGDPTGGSWSLHALDTLVWLKLDQNGYPVGGEPPRNPPVMWWPAKVISKSLEVVHVTLLGSVIPGSTARRHQAVSVPSSKTVLPFRKDQNIRFSSTTFLETHDSGSKPLLPNLNSHWEAAFAEALAADEAENDDLPDPAILGFGESFPDDPPTEMIITSPSLSIASTSKTPCKEWTPDSALLPGSLALAADRWGKYWPAKVVEIVPPRKPGSTGRYKIMYLDATTATLPREKIHTMDSDGFITCPLGHVEETDRDKDNDGIKTPLPREPSPVPLSTPPTSDEFSEMGWREQVALIRPVLQKIILGEYRWASPRHNDFLKGGRSRQALSQNVMTGSLTPAEVHKVSHEVRRWALRGERWATMAASPIAGTRTILPTDDDVHMEHESEEIGPVSMSPFPPETDWIILPSEKYPRPKGCPEYEALGGSERSQYCSDVLVPEALIQLCALREGLRSGTLLCEDDAEEDKVYQMTLIELAKPARDAWVGEILAFRQNRRIAKGMPAMEANGKATVADWDTSPTKGATRSRRFYK
ncbi:hypothetical protein FRB99_000185 [Tulasnella sp. 403]|nr:hypothetical protein FRB99_000185 [Tulasnella sp. 403]